MTQREKTTRDTVATALGRLPLMPIALTLVIGTAVGMRVDAPWGMIATIGLATIVVFSFFRKRLRHHSEARDRVFLGLACCCAFTCGAHNAQTNKTTFANDGERYELTGTVVRMEKRDSTALKFIVETDSVSTDGRAMEARCAKWQIESTRRNAKELGDKLMCGDKVRVSGLTVEPQVDMVSGFDYREYLETQGVSSMGRGSKIEKTGRDKSIAAMIGMICEWYGKRLERMGVAQDKIGFLRALTLGDRSELRSEMRNEFATCGTAHVLAVSGLHVGVLAWAVGLLMSLFCSRKASAVMTILALWAYAMVVGMGPSVVRAAIMFSFVVIGGWGGRRSQPFSSLVAAMTLIVAADPMSVENIGFWLSFSAVGGLCMAVGPAEMWLGRMTESWSKGGRAKKCVAKAVRVVGRSLAVSIVAQIATTPVSAHCFGYFPTYFWMNNLIVIPSIWLTFNMAVFGPLVADVWWLGDAAGATLNALSGWIEAYSHRAAGLPMAEVSMGPQNVWKLAAMAFCAASLLVWARGRGVWWRRAAAVGLATLFVTFGVVDLGRENEVSIVSSGGRVNLLVSDGWSARALMSDTEHSGSRRAVKAWARHRGLDLEEVRNMGELERVEMGGKRIAVVNGACGEIVDCDVCVINCEGWLPTLADGAECYLANKAGTAGERAVRLEPYGVVRLTE